MTILRITSVIYPAMGGKDAGLVEALYSFLLRDHGLDHYSHIFICEVESIHQEQVTKVDTKVFVSVHVRSDPPILQNDPEQLNGKRISLVNTALLKMANLDSNFDPERLHKVLQLAIESRFPLEFTYKTFNYPSNLRLVATVRVALQPESFFFYIMLKKGSNMLSKKLIYQGLPIMSYFDEFFYYSHWASEKLVEISGKSNEVIFRFSLTNCKLEVENLTKYKFPPFFQLMKANITEKQREQAFQIWINSLPATAAAIKWKSQ